MKREWVFELQSWIFIILVCVLFITPIYIKTANHYMFYVTNILSIAIFLKFTKIFFLLRFTPYARSKWVRLLLVFLPIPLFMIQVDGLFEFQKFVDEEGMFSFFKDSDDMGDYEFAKFIKYQFIFFSVGSIVTIIFMPIRMIISFWRTTNTENRV